MHYRLADWDPQPGSNCYDPSLLNDPNIGPALSSVLEDMLKIRLSSLKHRPPEQILWKDFHRKRNDRLPDIFEALPPSDPDRVACEAAARALDPTRSARDGLRLLAVAHEPGPDGFLTIAALDRRLTAPVRENDHHFGGVALTRDSSGEIRVLPRLFRLVCSNGSTVCTAASDGVVPHASGIEDAIHTALDPQAFEEAITALRAAADEPVDPSMYADEFRRLGPFQIPHTRTQAPKAWSTIVQKYRDEGDPTAYGLFNAMTATARDLESDQDRIHLETVAWRLLIGGRRPRSPRVRGGATLVAS